MSSHGWVHHLAGAGARWSPKAKRRVAASVVAVAVAGGAYAATRQPPQGMARLRQPAAVRSPSGGRVYMPLWLAQFVAGSFAECVQALVLYPLDTLKVNCQSSGQGALATLRHLLRTYPGTNLVSYMYNGAGAMALASILIGSVYYVAFKQSTLLFATIFPAPSGQKRTPPDTALRDLSPDGASGAAATAAGAAVGGAAAAAASAAAAPDAAGDARADVCAAMVASICAGVIEGPVECVRNRVQAGVVQQRMLPYLLQGGGLAAALPFFVPHLLKTLPYDVAELVTYSALTKHVEARDIRFPFSQEVRDALIGGAAGAAAVIASAPADCIKTRIVTMSPVVVEAMAQPSSTAQLWRAASRHIMRTQGFAGMFVGTLPRLVEKVPSTMMYWVAIEACARFLKRFTREGAEELDVADFEAAKTEFDVARTAFK